MENIDLKIVEVKGITPEILKKMISEFNDPSQEQKEAEEIFRLRESLSKANEQNEILADDRKRLKNIVDLALSVIIHISIADNNSIKQIQELKTKAEQAVRASEILDILIS
ncbi:hypothetical protein [Clostridium beijerinckii]|uniref:hypothetical protein n=2 Tax=Clostridium beijerinckii TaxID=1520 RepID=UPI00136E7465|nr:hypothetical protein [Clostridium beijerinckii]MZL11832.1 hypothetical protein [Clostridium beijerinckii]MZL31613.1 hypothetical protein [Clostridium beijerinckii]